MRTPLALPHLLPPAAITVLALGLAACASSPREIEYVPGSVSADGLYEVVTTRVDRAWVKPGARLGEYSKIVILPVTVAYKRPPRPSRGEYALTPRQLALVERSFQKIFEEELGRSTRFSVVSEPGPDVLSVQGRIVDLVVEVGPPEAFGPNRDFVRRAGAMTLILGISDSISGEPLAQISERRVVSETGGFQLYESNPVTNTARVRSMFTRWAGILRDGLDALHDLPEIPAPPDEAQESG